MVVVVSAPMLRSLATLGLLFQLATAAAADAEAVDTVAMWRQLEAHCGRGLCSLAEGSQLSALANSTDCKGRMLAYEFGLKLLPERAPQLESFDALQLEATCGVARPAAPAAAFVPALALPGGAAVFHVDAATGDDDASNGSEVSPFRTVQRALVAARAAANGQKKAIVLKQGVHYISATIELGAADSGTVISAAPGSAPGSVVVSGGVLLQPTWAKSTRPGSGGNATVYETTIPAGLAGTGFKGLTTLSPHRRAYPMLMLSFCCSRLSIQQMVQHDIRESVKTNAIADG